MGVKCCRERPPPSHLLPSDSQSDEGREELERQESVLRKQETELTDKQSRYLSLMAQLEDEKAKVSHARKDLSDALTESEIFKSTIKELNSRLKTCQESVNELQSAQEEYNGLSQAIQQVDNAHESSTAVESEAGRLQAEIEVTKRQIEAASSEFDRAKSDLETHQNRLRTLEESIFSLEKQEIDLEARLGEEMSKHEAARRKAYLRGLYLFALRRVQRVTLKFILIWSENTRKTTRKLMEKKRLEREFEDILTVLEGKINAVSEGNLADIEQILEPICASSLTIKEMHSFLPRVLNPLSKAEADIHRLELTVDNKVKILKEQYENDENTITESVKIDLFRAEGPTLQVDISALSEGLSLIHQVEVTTEEASALGKESENALSEKAKTVPEGISLLTTLETEVTQILAKGTESLPQESLDRATRLITLIKVRRNSLVSIMEKTAETAGFLDEYLKTLAELREMRDMTAGRRGDISAVQTKLEKMLETAAKDALFLQEKSVQSDVQEVVVSSEVQMEEMSEETMVSDSQNLPVETEVASSNPVEEHLASDPPVQNPENQSFSVSIPELAAFPPTEIAEIESNPVLKAALKYRLPNAQILSNEQFWTVFDGLLTSFFHINPLETLSPRVTVSVLHYFLSAFPDSEERAMQELSTFSESVSHMSQEHPGSYVHLLSRVFGLSLKPPMFSLQAKALIIAESCIHESVQKHEKKVAKGISGNLGNLLETGGRLYLTDGIRAVYRLFGEASALGEVALEGIKPRSVSVTDHVKFSICFRLKELNMDSMKLFKLIDVDKSGKIDSQEFCQGVREHLRLWISSENIKLLFSDIDHDGSGTISKMELNKVINMKEYYGKCESEEFSIAKIEFLSAILAAIEGWKEKVLSPVEELVTALSGGSMILTNEQLRQLLQPFASELTQEYVETTCSVLSSERIQFIDLQTYLIRNPPANWATLRNVQIDTFQVHNEEALSPKTKAFLQTLDDIKLIVS